MMETVHYVKVELACILKLDKWNSTRYGKNGTKTGDKKGDATDESYRIPCMIERAYYMEIEFA